MPLQETAPVCCVAIEISEIRPSLAAVSFASPAPPSSAGTGICTGRKGTSPSRTEVWLRSLTALLAQPCGCLRALRIAWQSRSRCEDAFADRMTNILYPKFPFAALPAMLAYAAGGAVLAGLYGIAHDQVPFSKTVPCGR